MKHQLAGALLIAMLACESPVATSRELTLGELNDLALQTDSTTYTATLIVERAPMEPMGMLVGRYRLAYWVGSCAGGYLCDVTGRIRESNEFKIRLTP